MQLRFGRPRAARRVLDNPGRPREKPHLPAPADHAALPVLDGSLRPLPQRRSASRGWFAGPTEFVAPRDDDSGERTQWLAVRKPKANSPPATASTKRSTRRIAASAGSGELGTAAPVR